MIEWNGADPKECAWAEREMAAQRRMRLASGENAICHVCHRQGPTAWMVDGHCGPNITPRLWVCQPPLVRDKMWRAMKRWLLVGAFLLVGVTGAVAQDFIFTSLNVFRDLPAPPPPCAVLGPAQPVVYDTTLWLFYTCDTGEVIARRFFNPVDNTHVTPTVTRHVEMPSVERCIGSAPALGWMCVRGGWVPSDHPLAR